MSYRKILQEIVAFAGIIAFLAGCTGHTGAPVSTPKSATPIPQDLPTATPAITKQSTATQPTIPKDWKLTTDSTGKCRVATPPDWQMGADYFLEAEKAAPPPIEGMQGWFPPSGLALWGVKDTTELPPGRQFQIRTSLVNADRVCSVWRIKPETDFTTEETALMEQVGKTLQEASQ